MRLFQLDDVIITPPTPSQQAVRQGLKKFSDWPTYPQLYIAGELIGGLDIIKEMVESDTLKDVMPKEESLNDRLKASDTSTPPSPSHPLHYFILFFLVCSRGLMDRPPLDESYRPPLDESY